MKQILKIKSITDVITNSSSEVFVMRPNDWCEQDNDCGGCLWYDQIDMDWIKSNFDYESELICETCGLDMKEMIDLSEDVTAWWPEQNSFGEYYIDFLDEKAKEKFFEHYRPIFEEKIIGCWFVEIEDHSESACELTQEMRDSSYLYTSYRH